MKKQNQPQINLKGADRIYRKDMLVTDGMILMDTNYIQVSGREITVLNAWCLQHGVNGGQYKANDKTCDKAIPSLEKFITKIESTIECSDMQLVFEQYHRDNITKMARIFTTSNGQVWGMNLQYFNAVRTFDIRWDTKNPRFVVFTGNDEFVAVIMPMQLCDLPHHMNSDNSFTICINNIQKTIDLWNKNLEAEYAAKNAKQINEMA
jgi:hypothetical protein